MRCNTLVLVEEECLQWLSECRLSVVESLSWSGNKFQTVGPATENARLPSVLRRWCGMVSKQRRVERSRWRLAMSDTWTQQSTRYCGALLWRHQWTITPTLYRTRSATSSQCKSPCRICDSSSVLAACYTDCSHGSTSMCVCILRHCDYVGKASTCQSRKQRRVLAMIGCW